MPGKIINWHTQKVKGNASIEQGAGSKTTLYRPEIIYTYEVHGQRLAGKRIRFASEPHARTRSATQERVSEYPSGALVAVYYDPAKPSESVLKPGVAVFWSRRITFSVALLAIGIALWLTAMARS